LGLGSRLGLREGRRRHGEHDRGYKQTFHFCSLVLLVNNPPDSRPFPPAIQQQRWRQHCDWVTRRSLQGHAPPAGRRQPFMLGIEPPQV
jgi:hypothetical protein